MLRIRASLILASAFILSACTGPVGTTAPQSTIAATPPPAGTTSAIASAAASQPAPTASGAAGLCGPIDPPGGIDEPIPWGEYSTGNTPVDETIAGVKAAGLADAETNLQQIFPDWKPSGVHRATFCFVDGQFGEFQSTDDSPDVLGSTGTFRYLDDDTLEFFTPITGTWFRLDFALDGARLRFSNPVIDPNEGLLTKYVVTSFTVAPYAAR